VAFLSVYKAWVYTVSGVGHGLAFPADKDGYYNALREFEKECGAFTKASSTSKK